MLTVDIQVKAHESIKQFRHLKLPKINFRTLNLNSYVEYSVAW